MGVGHSRYFAAKYFSCRYLGGIPQRETVVIHGDSVRGAGLLDLFREQALLQAKRKQQDGEILTVACLFAVLEDEDNGIF